MAIPENNDALGAGTGQFDLNWDWKGEYVSALNSNQDGYERFSQLSATPDTTALYGGPARFSAIGKQGGATALTPLGLVSGIQLQSGVGVQRMFEIGSNRSFFTRGKAAPTLSMSRMLADTKNIIAVLLANSNVSGLVTNSKGTKGPGAGTSPDIMMNLDSEYTNIPFGILMVMKTKGSNKSSSYGKVLSAIYLESCFMEGYGFALDSVSPVVQEGISIQFDRIVPVVIE